MTPQEWIDRLGRPYRPGQGQTPPRAILSPITEAIIAHLDEPQLARSPVFRLACALYEAGYYWETHELLEPLWLASRPNSRERRLLQALIQLANAMLKIDMKQRAATLRLLDEAINLLSDVGDTGVFPIERIKIAIADYKIAITTEPAPPRPTIL